MPCASLIDPVCVFLPIVNSVAGSAVGGGVAGGLAHAIQSGIAWLVSGTADWWIRVPSPDLAAEPAVTSLQRWLLPVTVAVAVTGMVMGAGKMAITRKVNPLIDIGSGLVVIIATSALGVLLPAMFLKAGDAWSSWVLTVSTGGQFGARLTALLTMPGASPVVVIILGVVAMLLAAVQAVLMLFRQAAVVVLAGVLPLAAAGAMAAATRPWFRKVTGWMLALICYKPAAAAVYGAAFTMAGTGRDPRTILTGFAMVLLSLIALPVLLKLFTWTTGTVDTSPGGGGFLGTLLSGAVAIGAIRASAGGAVGSPASEQARLVTAQLGPHGAGQQAGPTTHMPAAPAPAAPASASAARSEAGAAAAGPSGAVGAGAAAGRTAAGAATTAAAGGAAAAAGPAGAAVAAAEGAARGARRTAGAVLPDGEEAGR